MNDETPIPTARLPESPPPSRRGKAKGVGSIYVRNRVWWISYSINGKRERESSHSENRADAVRLLKDRLGRIGRHEPVGAAISRTTVADLKKILLDSYAATGSRSVKHAAMAFARLEHFFLPHQKAASITSDTLVAYKLHNDERGYKPATTEYDLAMLRRSFRLARSAGKVGSVPEFPAIKYDNVRKGFLEETDYRALLRELPEYLRPVLVVAYHSGWRTRSELLTRKVKHADLKLGTLMLEPGEGKTASRVSGFTPGCPKSRR
jgi:hypothetical protein